MKGNNWDFAEMIEVDAWHTVRPLYIGYGLGPDPNHFLGNNSEVIGKPTG